MAASDPQSPRQQALSLLAGSDTQVLSRLWEGWSNKPEAEWIRPPETGLIMMRGRIGGGGGPFNLGEATVSRASVRIGSGEIGHGYCLGRDTDKAATIAIVDALFQREPAGIEAAILGPLRTVRAEQDRKLAAETAATKVDFFTMVRGEDE